MSWCLIHLFYLTWTIKQEDETSTTDQRETKNEDEEIKKDEKNIHKVEVLNLWRKTTLAIRNKMGRKSLC